MDFKMLLEKIIELFVALVPAITFMIAVFNNKQKKIERNITNLDVSSTNKLDKIENNMESRFTKLLENNNKFNNETIVKVNDFLDDASETLGKYYDKIDSLVQGNEITLNIIKMFMETLVQSLAQDPEKIQNGMYRTVAQKNNMTKEELEKFPELLETDIKVIKKAMENLLLKLGQENFREILGEIGYEKKQAKKL